VAGCRLVTPNEREIVPDGFSGGRLARIAAAAAQARGRWSAAAVVVTLGSDGALLSQNDAVPLLLPAPRCGGTDPCGAGDRFATAAAIELARGALTSEAVQRAVTRATAFVEAGGAASIGVDPSAVSRATGARTDGPFGHLDRTAIQQATNAGIDGPLAGDPGGIVTRVRARGGAVVATGGCFDILHAGHIATLRAARELGDCLVVCVNSDESVRALKGPDRPLTPVHDRITMLRSLSCVDSVEVFDQPTPIQLLERLRPDVWVKGGDYYFDDTGDGPAMPEAEVLRTWGGQAVVVPYLSGYSTTGIIHAASIRGAGAKQDGRSTDA
jgi:rfaE bifunctional protein nucleotidyltransferase chain/domain